MQYKLNYEPSYDFECISIVTHIVSGTSIKDDMDECISENNAESVRPEIEELYKKAFVIENYVKDNINFSPPGYEETGSSLADFLFKKWDNTDEAPVGAIYMYDVLLDAGFDNKAVSILCILGLMESVWSIWDIENSIIPPFVSDEHFFGLINNSQLNQEDKFKALTLYYDFASYQVYTKTIIQQTEELYKKIIHVYKDEIKNFMEYCEKILFADNAAYFMKEFGISIDKEITYHVYPSVYHPNVLIMDANTNFIPSHIIIGIGLFPSLELFKRAESDNEKVTQFLKLLSDNTKQTILQLLKNEPLYGSQLAEKLNCTGANISQQMGALLRLEVVRVIKENNRVYFHLNKEVIHKYFDIAKELFGG